MPNCCRAAPSPRRAPRTAAPGCTAASPACVAGAYEPLRAAVLEDRCAPSGVAAPPDPLRWHPTADARRSRSTSSTACAPWSSTATPTRRPASPRTWCWPTASMERAFVNADGEMLLVPQQGALTITTELGVLQVGAGRDRAAAARPGLQGGGRRADARSTSARTTARRSACPSSARSAATGWPMRATSWRRWPRSTTTARRRSRSCKKFGGRLWRTRCAGLALQRRRLARQPGAVQVRHARTS